jgi:adenosyl cobinamide kinase/adenosyl cobinamide phosphate guanylyltransferase
LAEDCGGDSVTYIATAEVRDEEMADRVKKHRQDRPAAWQTLEEPHHPSAALAKAEHATVLLDCLTLLATNLLLGSDEQAAHEEIARLVDAALDRQGTLIVVSNEVGNGIVPVNALARQFRDLQGILNRRLAEAADTVFLVVAGQPLTLKEP